MDCKCGKDLNMSKLQTTYKLTYCKWQYGTLICPQCSCLNTKFGIKPDHIVGTPKKIFTHGMSWTGYTIPNGALGASIKIEVEYDVTYTIKCIQNYSSSSVIYHREQIEYIKDIPDVPDVILNSILFMQMNREDGSHVQIKLQIISMLESVTLYKRDIESTTNTKMQEELETATEKIKELESEKEKNHEQIEQLQSNLDISCDIQKDILIYTEELQANILELQTKLSKSKTEHFNSILEDALSEL